MPNGYGVILLRNQWLRLFSADCQSAIQPTDSRRYGERLKAEINRVRVRQSLTLPSSCFLAFIFPPIRLPGRGTIARWPGVGLVPFGSARFRRGKAVAAPAAVRNSWRARHGIARQP